MSVSVKKEFVTNNNRRIDILIHTRQGVLAIENKPSAEDSQDQVKAYLDYLSSFDNKFCLLYLSGTGEEPSEKSISQIEFNNYVATKHLCVRGYDRLVPWLARCRSVCKSSRVGDFLDDFSRYIEVQFMGIDDMSSHEHLIDKVTHSPELIAATFQVARALPQIRDRLLEQLKEQLEEKLRQADSEWELVWNFDGPKFFGFRFNKNDRYYFCFQFTTARELRGLICGLAKDKRDKDDDLPLVRDALNRINQGRSDLWWIWFFEPSYKMPFCQVEGDWYVNERPWLEILNGTLAQKIMGAAKEVNASLANADLLSALHPIVPAVSTIGP